ncbi:hypothetical protein LSTR_LSTR013078 [Laodelphax striatellus]|uniref:Protein YIPF n=1 Tax=Laodelphax striatellus TaxID=195883 RepID=A0A482XMJ8_LAOST|nr:hypothetical protein LSTR_LSTR013078 [Laodelphax striatellus]
MSKVSNLIDIESPDETRLQFQDFPISDNSSVAKLDVNAQSISFADSPEDPSISSPNPEATDSFYSESSFRSSSLLSFEFYQSLFDVNTDQVVDRIIWSMLPRPKINYLQHYIASKPDLYGPFWVCVTLVFTIAISGNIADYMRTVDQPIYNHHWKYDFHMVSASASIIFTYTCFLPVILWGVIKWQGDVESPLGLLELLCVYGYSMTIFIPMSVLWLIQIGWLQWLLVFVGSLMSGCVLITSVWPTFKQRGMIFILVIQVLHSLLAMGFMLHFFHVSNPSKHAMPTVPSLIATPTPALKVVAGLHNATVSH